MLTPYDEFPVHQAPHPFSDLSFDVLWESVSPAYLEHHHMAVKRGRRTTDQSRYLQPGMVSVGGGSCQIEHFVNGRYAPYGVEE